MQIGLHRAIWDLDRVAPCLRWLTRSPSAWSAALEYAPNGLMLPVIAGVVDQIIQMTMDEDAATRAGSIGTDAALAGHSIQVAN